MMMNVNNVYELTPTNGRKSFYGKALVEMKPNGDRVLYSYLTPIMVLKQDGGAIRLYDGWSNTTGSHIKSFCGMNKKEFFEIPYTKIE